jgi:signal transduction histidine kinase/CheY-like chemotaxis protein
MSERIPFHRRLAFRIVVPFAIALVLVFGLTAAYLGRSIRNAGLRELRDRGELLADTLAYNAELPLLAGDTAALTALLEGASRYPDLMEAEVLDRADRVLAKIPTADPRGLAAPAARGPVTIERVVYTQPSIAPGQEGSALALDVDPDVPKKAIGRVRLRVSPARTAARTRSLQLQIATVGLGLLLLSGGIGAVLVKILGAPIRDLVDATHRVATGDLTARVAPASKDEIGVLGSSFNRMAADLEVARAEVLAERADLERRVALRTAELERAQETLVQSEKMTAVGQLVAGVAHELNNPLTVVLGYAGLILERSHDPELRRKLELMSGEAERARKIVQNLLAFARKQKKERGRVDLNEVVNRTVGLRAYHLRSGNIRVESDLAEDLPATWADFYQLQQVVLNLLVNAEQAIQDSGRGSAIRIVTRREGDSLVVVVEDDGPGMPAVVRSKVFEPFFTTKPVGKGTGLGLAICYGIVGEHGGEIQVESEPDRFTRFRIRLPIVEVPADAGEHELPSWDLRPAGEGSTRRRILVIDDDPGILQFVEDAFGGEAVTIETALGGRDGIARLSTGRVYDVVLSDMRMPDIDGRSIFRYVRENRPELESRLVFATGDVANPDAIEFMHISGRPILEKPFSIRVLHEIVERVGG